MRPRAVHFNGQPLHIKKMTILNMRTKIIFHRNENKYRKIVWLKVSVDYIANSCWSRHFYFLSFFINQSLWLFEKVTFEILNKYTCTIDKRLPNSELQYKHDIDIFINESGKHSIVRYGGHYRSTINEWWLQKYVHLKYILWHFEYMSIITIKKNIIIVDWILCRGHYL
jgi:hypothetical protein